MKINFSRQLLDPDKENKLMVLMQIVKVVTQMTILLKKPRAQTSIIKSKKIKQITREKKEV